MNEARFALVVGFRIALAAIPAMPMTAAADSLPPLKLKPSVVWFARPANVLRLPSPDLRIGVGRLVKANRRVLAVRCEGVPTRCFAKGRRLCTVEGQCEGEPVLSRLLVTHIYADAIPLGLATSPQCLGILTSLGTIESASTAEATDAVAGCDASGAWLDFGDVVTTLLGTCTYERAPDFWQQYLGEHCQMLAATKACHSEGVLVGSAPAEVVQGELEQVWQSSYDNCCAELAVGVAATGGLSPGCP